jgi:Fur family ferric uptake transcriptional regulator
VVGRECRSHLHMKCLDCGRLLHLDGALSEALAGRIRKEADFALCEEETVLFGRCAACLDKKS